MKNIIYFFSFVGLTLFLNASEQGIIAQIPEIATNYAEIDIDKLQARVFLMDGTIVAEFNDCVSEEQAEGRSFQCINEEQKLELILGLDVYYLAYITSIQMEIFRSMKNTGRFEQKTAYSMVFFKTSESKLEIWINFEDDQYEVYTSCQYQHVEHTERQLEIYCTNENGNNILLQGLIQNDKALITATWNTPALADQHATFRGEIPIKELSPFVGI